MLIYCVVCMLSHVQLFGSPWTVGSLPGSSVLGILQARIQERVVISFSRGSFPRRDQTCISCVSCIGKWTLFHWASIAILINCPNFPLITVWFFFCLSKLILKYWKKIQLLQYHLQIKLPSLGFTSTGHWKSQWSFSVIFFKNKNKKGGVQ